MERRTGTGRDRRTGIVPIAGNDTSVLEHVGKLAFPVSRVDRNRAGKIRHHRIDRDGNILWAAIPWLIESNCPREQHIGDRDIKLGRKFGIGTRRLEAKTHSRDKNTARCNVGADRPRSIVRGNLRQEQVEQIERRSRLLETENFANLNFEVDRKAYLESGMVGNVGREPLRIGGKSFPAIRDRGRAVIRDWSVGGAGAISLAASDSKSIELQAHGHLDQKHGSHRAFAHDGSQSLDKVRQSGNGFGEVKRDDKRRRGVQQPAQALIGPKCIRRI